MQNYKLIAFDLDGTLLNKKAELPGEAVKSLHLLERRGVTSVIISGRPVKSILLAVGDLTFPYVAGLNGAIVYSPLENRVVSRECLDDKSGAIFLEYLRCKNLCALVCTSNAQYTTYYSDDHFTRLYQESLAPLPLSSLTKGNDIASVQIMTKDERECALVENELTAQLGQTCFIENCGFNYLQINKKGIDKAFALKYIIQQLKIDPLATIAVGDSNSDISMIKAAGLGIGMLGGSSSLLSASNDITEKDNDNNGSLHLILKKYIK